MESKGVLIRPAQTGDVSVVAQFAKNQARTKGLKSVMLDVMVENEGERRFYKRMGFQTIKMIANSNYCKRFNIKESIRMAKTI